MPKRFIIPNGGELQLTDFPWMTNFALLGGVILSLILSDVSMWYLGIAPAIFLLCLFTMHYTFCRYVYFIVFTAVLVFSIDGILYSPFVTDRKSDALLIFSSIGIVYALCLLVFGWYNFQKLKASL